MVTSSNLGSTTITRPKYEDGDKNVTVTLKLYAPDTANADINADTAEPLATHDFTIVLEKDVKKHDVTIAPKDEETGAAITGATIAISNYDNGYASGTVYANDDGTYTLVDGSKYRLSTAAIRPG